MNNQKVKVRFFDRVDASCFMEFWDAPVPQLKAYVWAGAERYIVKSLDYSYPEHHTDYTMVDVLLEYAPITIEEEKQYIW